MFHILALTLAAALAPAEAAPSQAIPVPVTGLDISIVSIVEPAPNPRKPHQVCGMEGAPDDALLSGDEAARKAAAGRLGGIDATVVVLHDLAEAAGNGSVAAHIALRRLETVYVGLVARAGADGALGDVEITEQGLASGTAPRKAVLVAKPGAPAWYALGTAGDCVLLRLEPSTSAARSTREIVPSPASVTKSGKPPESVTPARIVERPGLVYPELAYRQGREGTVSLRSVIDRDGHIAYARVTSHPHAGEDLALAALQAALLWRYEPARRGKDAIPSAFATNITFQRPVDAPPPDPPLPQTPMRQVEDALVAASGGLHVRLYAVTGRSSSPLPGARCATPVQPLPSDLDDSAIARTFNGATATRVWYPAVPSTPQAVQFLGATRASGSRLFIGLRGQTDDTGAWSLQLRMRDMDALQSSGPREFQLAPGGAAWFAEKLRGQCIVARVSADTLPAKPDRDDSAAEPRTVTPDITPPVLIKPVNPGYPEAARKEKREGKAVITAVIDADGSVTSASVLTYPERSEDLALDALNAVSQWIYRPAVIGGKPARVYFTVQVTYRLK